MHQGINLAVVQFPAFRESQGPTEGFPLGLSKLRPLHLTRPFSTAEPLVGIANHGDTTESENLSRLNW